MPNNDTDNIEKQLAELKAKIDDTGPIVFHKDETRRRFALYFLIGYFALLICVLVFIFLYNKWVIISAITANVQGLLPNQMIDLERVFFLLTSAFGPTLGFIIGYYFKDDK